MTSSVDPLAVGSSFVKTYYSTLVEFGESSLAKFYQKSPTLSFGVSDDFAETTTVRTFPSSITSVDISAVDAQLAGTSILLVITGNLIVDRPRGFVQTFVLNPQGTKSFAIGNDILRLLERDEVETKGEPEQIATVVEGPPIEVTPAVVAEPVAVEPVVAPVQKPKGKNRKQPPPQQSTSPGNGVEESKEPVLTEEKTNGNAKPAWGARNNTNPKQPKPTRDPDCTIIVKQIDDTVTSQDLTQVFSPFGEIVSISVLANRGFAYVDFATKEPVRKILAQDNFIVQNRPVTVSAKVAMPHGNRAPGRRSGRFYHRGGRGRN